ncbi:site-specific integrase [Paragemmobacter straminiformis]|uniref:Site-specific integrase n=1 Tax=Paragemmobacter straminiformis TaxID=2045119 RepID=A0A842I709_9RHOB|nr:site-specific integrase [Gemmobacter straminiformis]MBC2835157.1 site-specific integrase [Gemmobacter straminiformis]
MSFFTSDFEIIANVSFIQRSSIMMNIIPGRASSFADVVEWARLNRGLDDFRAVARVEKLWENVPLFSRPADLGGFEKQFPLHGFDPAVHKSEFAYKAWRRKVVSVLKAFAARQTTSSALVKQVETDGVQLVWQRLLGLVVQHVESSAEPALKPQQMLPVQFLSRHSVRLGITPADLSAQTLTRLGADLDGNDRRTVIAALRILNRLRSVPRIEALLGAEAYTLSPWPRRHAIGELPEALRSEIEQWLDVSCGGSFDLVADMLINATSKSDRAKKSVALRRFCEAAIEVDPARNCSTLAEFMNVEIATAVLRRWLQHGDKKRLSNRTISSYFKAVKTVAAHNQVDVAGFCVLERTTVVLTEGRRDGDIMSLRVRKFCETLLGTKSLQVKLLTLHVQARRLAQSLLDRAEANERELSGMELYRVRQLGAFAAFCAIETCAVPLRIENVMRLTFRGPDANLLMPTTATPFARIMLPGKVVKNQKPVDAALRQDRRNGLDTLRWYLSQVRPLFPSSDGNDHLFPAVRGDGPLSKTLFRNWFIKISRSLGLPMRPHNFRHGLASLLIQQFPGQYEAVAVLLGDTESTVRKYYAWVNRRLQIEAAQALVVELANAA